MNEEFYQVLTIWIIIYRDCFTSSVKSSANFLREFLLKYYK